MFGEQAGATVKHLHINGTCAGAQVLAAGGLHAESIDCLQLGLFLNIVFP